MRLAAIARFLFALSMAGLGALTLVYHELAPLWRPLAAWIPWICGPIVLAASIGLWIPRTALLCVSAIGAYLAAWVLCGVPALVAKPLAVGSWYAVCEALGPFAAAWVLGATLCGQWSAIDWISGERAMRAGRVLFGLSCVVYGLAHFAYADFTAGMVPGFLPDRLGVARLTGLAHIAAGAGIAVNILPRLAAMLEAAMMSSFGLLVWLPTLFESPPPAWATPPRNQWSEIVVTLLLAASAWIVAASLRRPPRRGPGSEVRAVSLGRP